MPGAGKGAGPVTSFEMKGMTEVSEGVEAAAVDGGGKIQAELRSLQPVPSQTLTVT